MSPLRHKIWYQIFFCSILIRCIFSIVTIKTLPATNDTRYVIHSEKIITSVSRLLGFQAKQAKGVALPPPFILLRRENHPMNETWIRHEQTHHLQIAESLYVWQLVSKLEYRYARIVLKKDHMSAYLWKATEQEAYLHQNDPSYNQTRTMRATWYHLWHKTIFHIKEYQVVIENKTT